MIVSFCEINKLDPNIPRVRSKLDSDRNTFNKLIEKKTCIRIFRIDISVLAALFFLVLKTAVGVFLQAYLPYMIEQKKNCVESNDKCYLDTLKRCFWMLHRQHKLLGCIHLIGRMYSKVFDSILFHYILYQSGSV